MPRRGWQSLDVPSGWVQVLRRPRPPSEHDLTLIDTSQCVSARSSLHRQSDVLDVLEEDLMSHRNPNDEAPRQSSTAIVASQGVRPTPSIFARGAVEISSGEEVLVCPNVGRDVAARISRSSDQLRPTSVESELSSFHEDHPCYWCRRGASPSTLHDGTGVAGTMEKGLNYASSFSRTDSQSKIVVDWRRW